MEFPVEITTAALADAENYIQFLRENRNEPGYAERWWNGFVDAVLSLEAMPLRCPKIPERRHFKEELRHLIYRRHRIIFSVSGQKVTVVRIYHGAQRPLSEA